MSEKLICGDALEELKKMGGESVDCCITSPPYWGLRDYGTAKWEGGSVECDHKKPNRCGSNCNTGHTNETGIDFYQETCAKCGAKRIDRQLGLEKTPEEYVAKMVEVFGEVKRVLKKEGTLWLNLGDSYAGNREKSGHAGPHATCGNTKEECCAKFNKVTDGLKPKDLVGIPWRVAFALQSDGWYLRQDIIWHKPNPMPESVTDRCTKAHEYIFLLAKSQKYYFDADAIKEKTVDNEAIEEYNNKYERSIKKSATQIQSQSTRQGEAFGLQQVGKDETDTQEICDVGSGQTLFEEVCGEIQAVGQKKNSCGQTHKDKEIQGNSKEIPELAKGQGVFSEGSSQETSDDEVDDLRFDGRTVGNDKKRAGLSLCDLPSEKTTHQRPYNSDNEGRATYSEKYTSTLSELQHKEGHKNIQPKGQFPNSFHIARTQGKKDTQYSLRNKRSVWTVNTKPFKGAHFATFPEDLILPCVLAGCPKDGTILDPFSGAGTTGVVAKKNNRNFIGIELNENYFKIAQRRINNATENLL